MSSIKKEIEVKVINGSQNELPKYETKGAAGMDVRAELSLIDEKCILKNSYLNEDGNLVIEPFGRAQIPTGLKVAIPNGHEIQVRSRSGLAIKKGLIIANSVGCVDSDFRGGICVLVINCSSENIIIPKGERIAQFILSPVEQISWKEVEILDETERGEGGFGHTGTK